MVFRLSAGRSALELGDGGQARFGAKSVHGPEHQSRPRQRADPETAPRLQTLAKHQRLWTKNIGLHGLCVFVEGYIERNKNGVVDYLLTDAPEAGAQKEACRR